MHVKAIIAPGVIFAAGSFASAANAATVIDVNISPTEAGAPIVLEGGGALGAPQFNFYDESFTNGGNAKYEIAANPADTTAGIFYQGNSVTFADPLDANFGSSAYTRADDDLLKDPHGDGNYALRFSANSTTYTGFATVTDDGSLIDSVTYQAAEPTAPVPEPATWAMMILGMGAVGATMRRRRRQTGGVALAA